MKMNDCDWFSEEEESQWRGKILCEDQRSIEVDVYVWEIKIQNDFIL